jgi:hypothetical protein
LICLSLSHLFDSLHYHGPTWMTCSSLWSLIHACPLLGVSPTLFFPVSAQPVGLSLDGTTCRSRAEPYSGCVNGPSLCLLPTGLFHLCPHFPSLQLSWTSPPGRDDVHVSLAPSTAPCTVSISKCMRNPMVYMKALSYQHR